MSILIGAREMRAAEAAALAMPQNGQGALMERAGEAALGAVMTNWPELAGGQGRAAVVLCGAGNNGGDGYVIARHLAQAGWSVTLCAAGSGRSPPDAARARAAWERHGPVHPASKAPDALPDAALLVDAVFGIGLSRPVSGEMAQLFERIAEAGRADTFRRVAVDIPSGLDADSGRCHGACLPADLTVTFAAAKPGHYLASGPELSGRLVVADIGIDIGGAAVAARLAGPPAGLLKRGAHKFDHGHALVLAGGSGRGGAGRLAARAALRIGAGLVSLAPPPDALAENAAQLEAVMLRTLPDAAALTEWLAGDERINALCLGPGLGTDARAGALLRAALDAGRPTVLDADALTLLSREDAPFALLHEACVLTPHGGEFARLFPDISRTLGEVSAAPPGHDKLSAVREAAARAGCHVLLKGHDTVIAAPSGETWLSSAAYGRAAPWLATAGAGDVLAGLITGLLARGMQPLPAARDASWMHVSAALEFGPGLIAEDLERQVPAVLRALC
ncbi:NAD(P)H-hydrate dehydratase [Profundibacterium mesophilum]|uniref:Bifunctional NAD(P)H-hydrate repair enzyme n=1 Tax=Profundibacterium mesophilum KAUST100406-0324 TaxID=1037889 RepID=A0A921TBU1_9RHOB|nr:NAD(P)H-hydrate dehydratase [Profundibacterium mesophilum]KAF0674833.1 YjeF family protein [Profundibacterium mesophilum KAUST100406-0324]